MLHIQDVLLAFNAHFIGKTYNTDHTKNWVNKILEDRKKY